MDLAFELVLRHGATARVLVQFCMAHLIRDVKFLITLADKKQQAYVRRLRGVSKGLLP